MPHMGDAVPELVGLSPAQRAALRGLGTDAVVVAWLVLLRKGKRSRTMDNLLLDWLNADKDDQAQRAKP